MSIGYNASSLNYRNHVNLFDPSSAREGDLYIDSNSQMYVCDKNKRLQIIASVGSTSRDISNLSSLDDYVNMNYIRTIYNLKLEGRFSAEEVVSMIGMILSEDAEDVKVAQGILEEKTKYKEYESEI